MPEIILCKLFVVLNLILIFLCLTQKMFFHWSGLITPNRLCTVCQRISAPFYKASYYTKWLTTSWTYSSYNINGKKTRHMKVLIDKSVSSCCPRAGAACCLPWPCCWTPPQRIPRPRTFSSQCNSLPALQPGTVCPRSLGQFLYR